jgi:hypothetical protein
VSERTFTRSVAVLAVLRIVPSLIVLAANGHSLPLLPGSEYGPPTGDTYGFYAAAREFISAWGQVSKPVAVVLALLLAAGAYVAWRLWRTNRRAWAVVVGATLLGVAASAAILEMGPTGAGAVGWPIVWAIPLAPLRVLHALSYHLAFYAGATILIASNVVTVIATSVVARRLIPGRLALLPPALLVVWPFLMRLIEGTGNGVYGSWLVDAGIALYSEPLSTALVTVALALIVLRTDSADLAAVAGAAMAFATAVRVSNATVAVVLFLALCVARAWRSALSYAGAGIGLITIAAVFWSRGYSSFHNRPTKEAPNGLFSWHYIVRSWRDSTVFDWKMLLILLPLPIIGAIAIRRRWVEVVSLAGTVLVTALFYSLYYITALHPRFLYVALPALFILTGLGLKLLVERFGPRPA